MIKQVNTTLFILTSNQNMIITKKINKWYLITTKSMAKYLKEDLARRKTAKSSPLKVSLESLKSITVSEREAEAYIEHALMITQIKIQY